MAFYGIMVTIKCFTFCCVEFNEMKCRFRYSFRSGAIHQPASTLSTCVHLFEDVHVRTVLLLY